MLSDAMFADYYSHLCWILFNSPSVLCVHEMQVKGKQNALKLIQSLQPSVVIPLINAKFHQSGPLSKLIHAEGSPEDLQGLLQHAGLQHVKVRMPAPPGKSFAVTL